MSYQFLLSELSLPNPLSQYAFFFDIDGTLTELKPTPEEVTISEEVHIILNRLLQEKSYYTIISGRSILDIDMLFTPFKPACAGIHGAELRYHNGKSDHIYICRNDVAFIWDQLKIACKNLQGLRLENKLISFAIHFRGVPELAEEALQIATSLAELYPDTFAVQQGKCVYELRPIKANKGNAVTKFMASIPLAGKIPIYIGDDITDESAFRVVNEMKGISIKVGHEETIAHYRLENVCNVIAWLNTITSNA